VSVAGLYGVRKDKEESFERMEKEKKSGRFNKMGMQYKDASNSSEEPEGSAVAKKDNTDSAISAQQPLQQNPEGIILLYFFQ
jgi:hypothetical protein